jgi:hypothetical protein
MLLVLVLLAAGAAGFEMFSSTQAAAREQASARAFDDQARAALLALAELRAAQQAYVAAGQGETYWIGKVASSLESLRGSIGGLELSAVSKDAIAALDASASVLDDFQPMDERAAGYARGGQRLLASDLVFADGLELTKSAARHLEDARLAEASARLATLEGRRRRAQFTAAGALGLAVMAVILLLPARSPGRSGGRLSPERRPQANADRSTVVETTRSASPTPGQQLEADPYLQRLAGLCTELAQVADAEHLKSALGRAAGLLDAQGLVIWMADPSGLALNPTLAHGYAAEVVSRLGSLAREDDNATAAAYRTGEIQIVKGDAGGCGALAVPLLMPAGCVGVMSAELTGRREQNAGVRALAAIVAAQVASLVGPEPAPAAAVQQPPALNEARAATTRF